MISVAINLRSHKVCLGCIELRPLMDFYRDNQKADGRCNWCNDCRKAATAKWRTEPGNIARSRANARDWNKRNRERARQNTKAYHAKFRKRVLFARKARKLWAEFGLTVAAFEALLGEQNGLCRICGMINDGAALCVDHAHVAGFERLTPSERGQHVRGLLCSTCNTGIGMFKDTPELLMAAARYVEAA